jgi:predicted secreted protein
MADRRSRRVAFVCHCLLNQNAKVEGFASHAGMLTPLVELLDRHGIGIVQLPCPEEMHLGIGRAVGDDTKQGYDTLGYRAVCAELADEIVDRARDYQTNGYEATCVLGVNGSPSCGVDVTPVRKGTERVRSPEMGIFVEALAAAMADKGVDMPLIGIPESDEAGPIAEALASVEEVVKEMPLFGFHDV